MAAITSAAIGAGLSIYSAIDAQQRRSEAENALRDLQPPELKNAAEGLQVSTLGAELQAREGARDFATGVDTLRSGGIRGVVGGLGALQQNRNYMNAQIGASLDQQKAEINRMIAQDNASIRSMQEQRYQGDVAALSSQYNAANQQFWSGLQGLGQSVSSGAQMYQSQQNFEKLLSKY